MDSRFSENRKQENSRLIDKVRKSFDFCRNKIKDTFYGGLIYGASLGVPYGVYVKVNSYWDNHSYEVPLGIMSFFPVMALIASKEVSFRAKAGCFLGYIAGGSSFFSPDIYEMGRVMFS